MSDAATAHSAGKTLSARYRVTRGDFSLDAELDLPLEGIAGIFGPSGAGKTTLLRLIAGLETTAGRLVVGDEVWQADGRPSRPAHQRRIGYVFQEPRLFSHLDVRGNLDYGRRRSRAAPVDFDRVVDLLGLGAMLHRRTGELSGGEAQRVAIARALLRAPRLVLMDEPLASLDQRRKQDILPFLDRLHRELEVPILYVSHAIDEICRLCDQLVVMDAGRIVASGPLQEVLVRTDLPSIGGDDAGSVIIGRMRGHDAVYDLSDVGFSGGTLRVPGAYGAEGAPLRVRVRASDVSLCRQRPVDTTILNVIDVEIEAIADQGAMRLVRLRAGEDRLLARITHRSLDELGLREGDAVLAQIKAVAIRQVPPAGEDR